MKIAFVFDDSLDRPDGVQQYVLAVGNWLTSQGHEVHYLVGQTTRPGITNVHSLARNIGVTFNGNRLSVPLPASRKAIKKLLDAEQFDVLHVQLPCSPTMAGRVVALAPADTRVVGTFHILPFSKLERAGARLLARAIRPTLARLHAVCSVSSAAQAYARQAFGLDSIVIPNVVDTRFYKAAHPVKHQGKHIVFLGRLVERKGCRYFLQALHELSQTDRLGKTRVTICGDGPLRQELEQYATEHHLQADVTFTGFVSESQKRDYLAAADLAVFPSLGGESFGIVLIEAMAAGAGAVLGGDNAGYRSVLGAQPQLLVNPHDTASFASRIHTLLHDSHVRSTVAAWQATAVRQYDVDTVGRQLLTLYQAKSTH